MKIPGFGKFDWQSVVKAVAPTIGMALGGPMGAMATRAVAGALLGNEDAPEKDIAKALAVASPDQLVALRTADRDFQKHMTDAGVDLVRIAQADRASARAMAEKTGDLWTPRALAIIVLAGAAAIAAMVVLGETGADPNTQVLVGAVVGYVFAQVDKVLSYYFGSSAGSKDKTKALTDALQQTPPAR